MSKRMTEAAKLYWKDIDILEEARSELVEYFDSVWSQTWERISSFFDETDSDSNVKIESYQDRQKPGKYSIILKQEQPASFEIVVRDPRRSDDWRFYNVKILCKQAQKRNLDKVSEDARTSIKKIALSHGIDIIWDNPKDVLYKTDIEVVSDNSDLVADGVVEIIEKMIGCITEAYTWMLEKER